MMLWKQLAARLKKGMQGEDRLSKANRVLNPSDKKVKADVPMQSSKAPDNAHKSQTHSS